MEKTTLIAGREKLALTRGVRFAPSPTGRFHVGNLRTAWVSREWAKKLSQPWVIRFEDIDAPRVLEGARETQLEDMRALGLEPDQVLIQSAFRPRHWDAFRHGVISGRVYPCYCSRKEVREALEGSASAPHGSSAIYSGRCRALRGSRASIESQSQGLPSLGWRFALDDETGARDFIVARTGVVFDGQGMPEEREFVPAYHWACAVDDWDGNYALLVRAVDLSEVVLQHRAIMAWLAGVESGESEAQGGDTRFPSVFHTALVTADGGARLEKRTQGVVLPELLARGFSTRQIVENFSSSFPAAQFGNWAAAKVFGESRTAISLSELGFVR